MSDAPSPETGTDPSTPASAPTDAPVTAPVTAADDSATSAPASPDAPPAAPTAPTSVSEPAAAEPAAAAPAAADGPADDPIAAAVAPGYTFEGPALELGGLMLDETRLGGVPIRIPLAMVNRHGLVAGATGTGKTKTLQLMAEQLSAQGVPVFAADIKGDLSGLSKPGEGGEKIVARAASVGQSWTAQAFPSEFYTLGGEGIGTPIRVTISSFGPMLLAKVLDLNETQSSSLGLIFHYADTQGLPLLDLSDLRALVAYLTSDEGKAELKGIGGLSTATAGVILRELVAFEAQGADAFFGEPEFNSADFLRVDASGRGIISLLELPRLQNRPALFSTFLMWLLADLFEELPEVGDIDKPKLVFFFDEAHLLFNEASKEFLAQITQTVRLIRSKGVGVFFVTQSPTDVPDDVLAQLGSRVQHQLRAHTPNDAKALKATVNTYPTSAYADLGQVITSLGIGEAVVTVMNERGAPTPVAWTRLRAPESLMAMAPEAEMEAAVKASGQWAAYSVEVDRESAREMLATKLEAGAAAARAEVEAKQRAQQEKLDKAAEDELTEKLRKEARANTTARRKAPKEEPSMVESVLSSGPVKDFLRTAAREIARGMFGKGRR